MSPANVQDRKIVRQALATLLQAALIGTGKPAQALYRYKPADFKGQSPVIVVTSASSERTKQAQVTRVASKVGMEIHTFVLYAEDPEPAINNPAAGANVVIQMANTSKFAVGMVVTVIDDTHSEQATITVVTPNTSITAAALVNSYTAPRVYAWTEENAEDRLDLLEKTISDVLEDNIITDTWSDLSFDGPSKMDPVAVGGKDYLHEIIPISLQLHSE